MPSLAALPCFLQKAYQNKRRCGAPTCTRDSRPPEWERRSLFMIASVSMPNGNPDPGLVPFEVVLTLTTHCGCLRYMSASACCALHLTAFVSANPPVPNKSTAILS